MKFLVKYISGLLAIMLMATTPSMAQDSRLSEKEVEAVVRKLLEKEPGLVIGAIQKFQHEKQREQIAGVIQNYGYLLADDKNAPFMGNANGNVTVVEFFDYRCGYCRRHYPEIKNMVEKDGNIKWVLKQYPVLDRSNESPVSRIASRASLAAHAQGKFQAYHDALMTFSGQVTEQVIYDTLATVGADVSKAKLFMMDKTTERSIETGLLLGAQLQINGTPFYLVGTDFMEGARGDDTLMKLIHNARAELN